MMYYFGCIGRPGHYFFDERLRSVWDLEKTIPWGYRVDGELQPHFKDCQRKRGCTYCACTSGPEGQALLHHRDRWTCLSFWDRSVDKRGACNSNFLTQGTFTFEDMLAKAKAAFPSITIYGQDGRSMATVLRLKRDSLNTSQINSINQLDFLYLNSTKNIAG